MKDNNSPVFGQDFSKTLPGGLTIRWSTPEDRAGIALTGALSWGYPEGDERSSLVRITEKLTMDEYWYGGSGDWVVCVGSEPRDFPRKLASSLPESDKQGRTRLSAPEDPYVASIRKAASSSSKPVLAVLQYSPTEWTFHGHKVKVAKVPIAACRAGVRATDGANVMKEMWKLLEGRASEDGIAFLNLMGIPNYYRSHGMELAFQYGYGFMTQRNQLSPLPTGPSKSGTSFTTRLATLNDVTVLSAFHTAASKASPIWADVHSSRHQAMFSYLLGNRLPPFDSILDEVPRHRFGKNGKPVAIAVQMTPATQNPLANPHNIVRWVRRLYYDPGEDVGEIAKEFPPRLFEECEKLLQEDVAELRKSDTAAEGVNYRLAGVKWALSEGHPVGLMMEKLGTASIPNNKSYSVPAQLWIGIPNLALFLNSFVPVFKYHLARAKPYYGASFSSTLRFATYSSRNPGAILHLSNEGEIMVSEKMWTAEQIANEQAPVDGEEPGPNVIGPRGAITQLLMGYATVAEIRRIVPDLNISKGALPLLEVLFPQAPPAWIDPDV